jgi:replication-associated recombination protein RarA
MFDLFGNAAPEQADLLFPPPFTERYRPRCMADFVGLAKPKLICQQIAAAPSRFGVGWLFLGPSGTGKTTMAAALAEMIPAEVHHVPSQECDVATLERHTRSCQYLPMNGKKWHLILVDEADQMSTAAQLYCLSKLDGTATLPNTLWVFTCNSIDRFQDRFLSRVKTVDFSSYGIAAQAAALLERVWNENAPDGSQIPNFARIVKESNNNVRDSLMRLELELMLCSASAAAA